MVDRVIHRFGLDLYRLRQGLAGELDVFLGQMADLDQIAEKGVVLVQLRVINIELLHVVQQGLVVLFFAQLDADQGGPCVFVVLLHVLEAGDVVSGSQYVVDEFFQRAGSLGKADQEIVFQTFVLQTLTPIPSIILLLHSWMGT